MTATFMVQDAPVAHVDSCRDIARVDGLGGRARNGPPPSQRFPPLDRWYNCGYTFSMKTAISIPDPVFDEAENLAEELGMSRSALYSDAVRDYVKAHSPARVTEALNRVYGSAPARLDEALAAMQAASIAGTGEW